MHLCHYINPFSVHTIKQVNLARERGADSIGCISTDGMFSSSADRLALVRTALLRRPHTDRQQPLQVGCV